MQLCELLEIKKGVTAVTGSGGKTTLLGILAEELSGTVILCTTTHIRKPASLPFAGGNPIEISLLLKNSRKICVGTEEAKSGKITAPALSFDCLANLADYVLVEADGSRQLPLKAHREDEPVIPNESNNIICVLGNTGIGRPVISVCHRPELFAQKSGLNLESPVTTEALSALLREEYRFDRLFINQCEEDFRNAEAISLLLEQPVLAGSLQRREWRQIS